MFSRRLFLAVLVSACHTVTAKAVTPTDAPLPVVATFSILADITRQIGGDRVNVRALVGSNGDAHVFQPSPLDGKILAEAKLIVTNGLGFEGWLERLAKSSKASGPVVVASKGIVPRKMAKEAHGHDHDHDASGADPHAWHSVSNVKIYVANIRDGLIAADPAGAETYRVQASAYLAQLDALEAEIKATIASIPPERRKVITTHDAFGYFAAAYGVAFIAPQGVSTESEASAKDVARIIRQIRSDKVPAVFLENVSDPRLAKRIAEETGAKLGGALYSDALTDEKGDGSTYIGLMRHNIKELKNALGL